MDYFKGITTNSYSEMFRRAIEGLRDVGYKSCSANWRVEKNMYLKGYHVNDEQKREYYWLIPDKHCVPKIGDRVLVSTKFGERIIVATEILNKKPEEFEVYKKMIRIIRCPTKEINIFNKSNKGRML